LDAAEAVRKLTTAGEVLDRLDLFRKNLQSFVRVYEFLSQIIDYDDRQLEQLCVYARHLYPLLRVDRLEDDEVDVSELALTHYRLTKRAEHELWLGEKEGEYGLKPISDVGTGKAHDPEKKRLSEIIEALNELFGADTTDADMLHYTRGVLNYVRRDETTMAQVRTHTPEQVMHGTFPRKLEDAVLDSMKDNKQYSMRILDNPESFRAFAAVALRLLLEEGSAGAGGAGQLDTI
jgi:type I restriction enzyme, R subunit